MSFLAFSAGGIMLDILGNVAGPWSKSALNTGGVSVERIKGLFRAEEYSTADANARFDRETKERYSHEEIFGPWWNVNAYIDVPVEYAYDYVANLYSIEEWSYGIRDLKHIGQGIYRGHDRWAKDTEIFVRSEPHKEIFSVDHHFAWDQKEDLWMRQFWRFVDAKGAINRSGTILNWFSFKHPFYDRKSPNLPSWLKDAQGKRSRDWLGDYWRYFHAWHKIEADNLRYILEHRFQSNR